MSLIGTRLKAKGKGGEVVDVIGANGGSYVIQRVDKFESPETVTVAELAHRFNVTDAETPTNVSVSDAVVQHYGDEVRGWQNLGLAHARAMRAPAPPLPLAEDVFAVANEADTDGSARRLAVTLLSGPHGAAVRNGDTSALSAHESRLLKLDAVEREVRALVAAEGEEA